jgi:tungstate transport system permease protein
VGALAEAARLVSSFDPEVWSAVVTSLRLSLTSTLLATLVGVPLGTLIALGTFPGREALRVALHTLMALPTVVVGLLVYGTIGRSGALGEWGLLFTPTAIVIGQFILVLPIIVHLSATAIEAADPRLVLTCRSLCAGRLRTAAIVAGQMRAGVLAAVVAGFGRVVSEVGVSMLLGGNIRGFTRTMTTAIALETGKGEFEFAVALGIILLAIAMGVNLALHFLGGRRR